jgi:hypothetical protein
MCFKVKDWYDTVATNEKSPQQNTGAWAHPVDMELAIVCLITRSCELGMCSITVIEWRVKDVGRQSPLQWQNESTQLRMVVVSVVNMPPSH